MDKCSDSIYVLSAGVLSSPGKQVQIYNYGHVVIIFVVVLMVT